MDVQDWQTNKRLADTNLYMLEHEIDVDVTFLVGEGKEEVKGHKFMLVSRSPVCYAMLLGPLAETSNTITVPDIDKKTFTALLRFLYTEEISLEAVTVMTVMYAAKKYGIQALVDKCSLFLKENMSTENVCTILNQAHMFDEDQLKKVCLTFIFENGTSVLKSEGFLKLNNECLHAIVESTALLVDGEEAVYKACVCWSREECKRQWDAVTDENCRNALGKIVFLIQFAAMGADTFTHYVSSENILTLEEQVSFYRYFTLQSSSDSVTVPRSFEIVDRQMYAIYRFKKQIEIKRFKSDGDAWKFEGQPDAVSFECSENVVLLGFRLYGPIDLLHVLTGTIRVEQDGQVLSEQEIRLENTGTEKTQKVMLDTKVLVEKGRLYDVIQLCEGCVSHKGEDGVSEHVVNGVCFTFRNCPLSRNSTSTARGQIAALIF